MIEVVNYGKKFLNSKSKIIFVKKRYYESEHLYLDSSKAKRLQWKTNLKSHEALKLSFIWYQFYYNNKNKKKLIELTFKQINDYKKKNKI